VLSNGERQRVAIARLLIHKPQVAVLDDALSALDNPTQDMLFARLRGDLPGTTIVSLGQQPGALGRHDRHYALERNANGAALVPAGAPAMAGAT
jgi:putative ATP-binding cassette transporter